MSPIERAAAYVGATYELYGRSPSGWDCWGCVRYLRAELFGKASPSWADAYAGEDGASASVLARTTERLVLERLSQWRAVPPRPGAVVLITFHERIAHVGLMLDDRNFIHAMAGAETAIAKLTDPRWRRRIGGFYDA